jgi:hypothetical protein
VGGGTLGVKKKLTLVGIALCLSGATAWIFLSEGFGSILWPIMAGIAVIAWLVAVFE